MWRQFKTIDAALDNAESAGYTLIAVEQAVNSIPLQKFTVPIQQKTAFIFGNEVAGVSEAALARVTACIEIPQWGAKHSLNISVSIGVVLWEIVRNKAG
jgi:tRNA G18 (ribose-2'-O)-methylase SpoU